MAMRPVIQWFAFTVALHVPLALAQSNLGELLDAGAQPLSVEDFRRDLVGRQISGLGSGGSNLQVVYLADGRIHGVGMNSMMGGGQGGAPNAQYDVRGSWSTEPPDRICASFVVQISTRTVMLPPRCQYWFKHKEQYFLSDSDSDRSMRVLRRAVVR